MKRSILVKMSIAMFVLTTVCTISALAQDPAKVAPKIYKVLLNNTRIRVLEVTAKAGQKTPMHSHLDYVVYSLGDGKVRHTDPKGASTEAELKAGEVLWRDAERHSSEVLTDIHVLLFEIKGRKVTRGTIPAGSIPDALAADPAHFKTLLDNERVRVLEFRAAPGEESPMHSHPYHVTYAFTATKTKFTDPRGKSVERSRPAGSVAITLPGSHSTKVTGDTASHVLLVELK